MCPDEKGAKQSIFFIHRAPRAGVEELVSELIWDSQSGSLALFGLQLSLGKLLSISVLFCKFVETTFNSSLSCHGTELSSINDACKMLWTFSNELIHRGKMLLLSVLLAVPTGACFTFKFLNLLLLSLSVFPIFPSQVLETYFF